MAWEEYCAEYRSKELQESMYRCTGRRDITEIMLKTALISIQSAVFLFLSASGGLTDCAVAHCQAQNKIHDSIWNVSNFSLSKNVVSRINYKNHHSSYIYFVVCTNFEFDLVRNFVV